MPGREAPRQFGGSDTQHGPAGWSGAAGQQSGPGNEFGSVPGGGTPGGGYAGDAYGSHWAGQTGWDSPVHQNETNVVGRRVIQYVIDYILVGIIPGIAYWLLDRGSGVLHGFGWALATLIALVVYLWYWVLRPNSRDGQTFGMQLLGLRIISKDGGPANMVQYFVRAVLLVVDTFAFGLVGLITMMASRYHQRVGDHVARTLVVSATQGRGAMYESEYERSGGGYRVEDERLARPDTHPSDSYGQDMGSGLGGADRQT
jgi:uncharacterized RDD family membrane protein YckC